MGQVILITGVSSGIGKACAKYLSRLGYNVYGTSRNPSKNTSYTVLTMDVTKADSVKQAVEFVIEKEGRIDVLVNNAGIGIGGAIEDNSEAEIRLQFETNFFGVHTVCKAVIPHMRNNGGGKIINMSSLGGVMGLPFQGIYSATKFAVEGYSEALRMELRQWNIKVVVINPGDFKTQFTHNRINSDISNSLYKDQFLKTMQLVEHEEQHGNNPVRIAKTIDQICKKKSPKYKYYVGKPLQVWFAKSKSILPLKVFVSGLHYYYKVK